MLDTIKKSISAFWAEHVCDTFPYGYDKECVKCNKPSCVDCPIIHRNKVIRREKEECQI
jgi:hypothetical protein